MFGFSTLLHEDAHQIRVHEDALVCRNDLARQTQSRPVTVILLLTLTWQHGIQCGNYVLRYGHHVRFLGLESGCLIDQDAHVEVETDPLGAEPQRPGKGMVTRHVETRW